MGKLKNGLTPLRFKKSIWSQDTSVFGREMMEKMGWETGKGLGRKEDGTKDIIQVDLKFNSKGLGFQGEIDKFQILDECSSVFAKLNSKTSKSTSPPSTPVPAKPSSKTSGGKKSRVLTDQEYQCIFGKPKKENVKEQEKLPELEEEKVEGGLNMFTSGQSSTDYFRAKFAEKMARLGIKQKPIVTEQAEKRVNENDDTVRPSFSENEDAVQDSPSPTTDSKQNQEDDVSSLTPSSGILAKTPKRYIYTNNQDLPSTGRKIKFSKKVSLIFLDDDSGTSQELVYPHSRKATVMERFREFNKENSSPIVHQLTSEKGQDLQESDIENQEDIPILNLTDAIESNDAATSVEETVQTHKKKNKKKKKISDQDLTEENNEELICESGASPVLKAKKKKKIASPEPEDPAEDVSTPNDRIKTKKRKHLLSDSPASLESQTQPHKHKKKLKLA